MQKRYPSPLYAVVLQTRRSRDRGLVGQAGRLPLQRLRLRPLRPPRLPRPHPWLHLDCPRPAAEDNGVRGLEEQRPQGGCWDAEASVSDERGAGGVQRGERGVLQHCRVPGIYGCLRVCIQPSLHVCR